MKTRKIENFPVFKPFAIKRPLWPLVGANFIAYDTSDSFNLKAILLLLEMIIYWKLSIKNAQFTQFFVGVGVEFLLVWKFKNY